MKWNSSSSDTFLASAKCSEILNSFWDDILRQSHLNSAQWRTVNGNVEEHLLKKQKLTKGVYNIQWFSKRHLNL